MVCWAPHNSAMSWLISWPNDATSGYGPLPSSTESTSSYGPDADHQHLLRMDTAIADVFDCATLTV